MDCIVESEDYSILEDCISGTSLKFLDEHSSESVIVGERESDFSKDTLLGLYEESTVNPEAYKQLITAIKSTSNTD